MMLDLSPKQRTKITFGNGNFVAEDLSAKDDKRSQRT